MPLENQKHELFLELVSLGESPSTAYRNAIATEKCKTATAWVESCRLLRHPKLTLRLQYLRSIASKSVEERFGVSRDVVVQWLLKVIETPIGDVDQNHELAQGWKAEREWRGKGDHAKEWETKEVKMPNKLQAAALLCQILGYKAPEKVQIDVTDRLAGLIAGIRIRRQQVQQRMPATGGGRL